MTLAQRIEIGKPYLTGFVLGLIAAPIIAFSAGWVSTSGARAEAVEKARIDTLASFCSGAVEKSLVVQNMDAAALKGYDNRAKREELVAAAMADIAVPDDLVKKVSAGCNRTLT